MPGDGDGTSNTFRDSPGSRRNATTTNPRPRIHQHHSKPHKFQVVLLQGALLLWSGLVLWRAASASASNAASSSSSSSSSSSESSWMPKMNFLPGAHAAEASTLPSVETVKVPSATPSNPGHTHLQSEPSNPEWTIEHADHSCERPPPPQTNSESAPDMSCEEAAPLSATQKDFDASTGVERFVEYSPQLGSRGDARDRDNGDVTAPPEIIIVSTVDGTLVGLCKTTGRVLWKRSSSSPVALTTSTTPDARMLSRPLVSTTTTKQSAKEDGAEWRTAAVPSIDGSVSLTAVASDASSPHVDSKLGGEDSPPSGPSALSAQEVTVEASLQELVARAPFVDARGRIYTGSRRATTFALDGSSGELLHAASDGNGERSPALSGAPLLQQRPRGGPVVWLGRVDYSVAIHEPDTGRLDVQFAAGSILGAQDLWLGGGGGGAARPPQEPWTAESHSSEALVATPNGNVAYRGSDPNDGRPIEWVADECFETPVAFAVDAASGASLSVYILPDAVLPHGSSEYVSQELERQLHLVHQRQQEVDQGIEDVDVNESWFKGQGQEDEFDERTIVGSLPAGDLYALPLGRSNHRSASPSDSDPKLAHKESPYHPQYQYASASSSANAAKTHYVARIPGRHSSTFQATHHSHANHQGDTASKQRKDPHKCHAGTPDFPRCLVDHHPFDESSDFRSTGSHFLSETRNAGNDPNVAALVVKYQYPDHGDGWYIPPPHYYTLVPPPNKRHKRYQKVLRILGAWLPIALVFVLSFELGRRKRQEQRQQKELEESNVTALTHVPTTVARDLGPATGSHVESVGLIQVFDDVILGYGGHGTVVYKGLLEGRQVAVKRMLRAYHASADREISLLIESDGHPNVVRYFLKEVRGDFVYLALELCDLSLHDLIQKLKTRWDQSVQPGQSSLPSAVSGALKCVLLQIACGVKHLHSLRIVHRDLKPMNILLADSRTKAKRNNDAGDASVLQLFDDEFFIAKISDMGLGKQLVGQSSFGPSLIGDGSLRGVSNGGQSSLVGIGPGSVGWQAPEVMALRSLPSDVSVRSDESVGISQEASFPDASPIDSAVNTRTSRSADIFSLGCVFYSVLLPGCHPFGEWFERESNIMRNRPDVTALEVISPAASDLISSMIQRNPAARPTAAQVCDHPFFWSSERRMSFVCDFSDRIESGGLLANGTACSALSPLALAVERNAVNVVGLSWDGLLDEDLVSNVQRFRTYDPSSVRDLLRLIRNKHHHFEELPLEVKTRMGSSASGLISYVEARFPRLLIHCFHVCRELLAGDDPLSLKYAVAPLPATVSKRIASRPSVVTEVSVESSEVSSAPSVQDPILKSPLLSENNPLDAPSGKAEVSLGVACNKSVSHCDLPCAAAPDSDEMVPAETYTESTNRLSSSDALLSLTGADTLVMWERSTTARSYNCRGWSRSDGDWERRTDAKIRKRDPNLTRCAEDPKFRTRLCNYWDASLGTACPMRKKNKCIFAHGPVELRVKEGKKHRWGKLVDKIGDNNNPNHSGGEDTYGAARSIEHERKQEGKWSTDKASPAKGKKPMKKKKTTDSAPS